VSKSVQASEFNLQTYLIEKKTKVEAALDASLSVGNPHADKIIESMKYSLMAGGKRIRPILCLAACEMFGGDQNAAMPTAVALEMIHTMSLIHDDLPSMDNDDLRRGKPTNHVLYGEDVAILAGDALLSTSFEYVATHTDGVPAERVVEILRRLGKAVGPYGLAGGQVKDLECENKTGVTLAELEWIHMHKTASLLRVCFKRFCVSLVFLFEIKCLEFSMLLSLINSIHFDHNRCAGEYSCWGDYCGS
jgi:geranylgeranyl diphosphate synthase type II